MTRNYFNFNNIRLSYLEINPGSEKKILITHANGYAAGCYEYLQKELGKEHHVCALDFAGHGASEATLDFDSWQFFRDQVLAFLDHKKWSKCSGIGHSLGGGSLLRAAQVDKDRFEKIIALDPVMLGFLKVTLVKLFGNPMAKVALNRRSVFKDKKAALKIFQRHPANRSWQNESVVSYVAYCLKDTEDKAVLCCPPAVESQVFSQASYEHLFHLNEIKCEVLMVLPEKSEVIPQWVAKKITANHPGSKIHSVKGGHLFPFEDHVQLINLIRQGL